MMVNPRQTVDYSSNSSFSGIRYRIDYPLENLKALLCVHCICILHLSNQNRMARLKLKQKSEHTTAEDLQRRMV